MGFPPDGSVTDEATFRNADNLLYDPTTVVLEVRNPNGTLSYPTVVNESVGIYRSTFLIRRGITRWEWDGITGTTHDRLEGGTCAPEGLTD
jgi:hypothetical protein